MVSFVIPCYNEEESVGPFFEALSAILPEMDKHYEIIFVDDGSTDETLNRLQALSKKHKHIVLFSFRRNLGKSEALSYGFLKAKNDTVITLDADLQDKPSEIPKLLVAYRQGYDVVSGWRKKRKDAKKMVIISKFFNRFVGMVFGLKLHDYNCGLKIYNADVTKTLHLYGGLHRFIPILAFQQGFRVTEVPIVHEKRKYGKSKYGFSKLWKDLPDMLTMLFLIKYSKRPMHFFGFTGGFLFFLGVILLGYLTILHFLGSKIGDRPLVFFGMLLVLAGFQIFFTGFLADLMINIFSQRSVEDKLRQFSLKYSSE